MHTLVERIFFVTCLQCNYKCHMQLKNVICNYFLVAYNTFSCIKQSIKNIFSSNVCWAKTKSLYINSQEKKKSSLSILHILYNICSYAH